MRTNTNWLMFRDEATIREWESETSGMLARVLHFSDPFQLSLSLPDEAAATYAWDNNDDLYGSVRIAHPFGLDVELKCHLPFDGVFITRRDDGLRPLPIVWNSWLCEAPGVRIVRPASKSSRDRGVKEIRVGLPGGNFIRAELCEKAFKNLEKKKVFWGQFDAEKSKYPEWLMALKPNDTWDKAFVGVKDHLSEIRESDQDDLEQRILMTFPIWLKYRVCKVLLAALPFDLRKAMYELDGDTLSSRIFDAIGKAKNLGARLVPLAVKPRKDQQRDDDVSGFVFVEPNNPVDLAARLTRVKRLQMSRHAMEEIPAEFRQNHPSFMGRICPVESPESELVGLSLQLAQGARIDKDGHIVPADQGASETMGYRANLGWGAGLIPLFHHNDGTRNMMGSKNLRQALTPAENREAPAIKSGGEADILDFTERLTKIGVCPDVADNNGEMALGRDLLVAYMPWYGWNMEDAIVIGRHVVDGHLFDVAVTKRVKKHVRPGWHPQGKIKTTIDLTKISGGATEEKAPSSLEEEGLAAKGATLKTGDTIVRLVSPTGLHFNEIRYNDASPAVVREINFGRRQEWMDGTLEYVLEKHIPLGLGDKLMGRHGNKGVIGRIEDTAQMPHLPDDERLPEEFRNRPIDIILNPHGVISRMNIGQLLETHLGWLAHAGGCKMADFIAEGCQAAEIGIPKVGVIDHEKVQDHLERTGLDRQGRIRLVLPDGSLTKSPVVVGFEHIVRLKHIPELKAQARRGEPTSSYDSKTGQAVHGRARGGGQRVGEMEVWALAGHEAECNLAEMLGGKADAVWARDWRPEIELGEAETDEGFPRLMKDWLFAVGIDMTRDNADRICFSLCTDADAIRKRINGDGKPHEVKTGDGVVKAPTASFSCCKKSKKGECGYRFPLDGLRVSYSHKASDDENGSLRVGDVLSSIGYKIAGPMTGAGDEYLATLESLATGKVDGQLRLLVKDYDESKDWLKFQISPASGESRPKQWPKNLDDFFCFGRFSANRAERDDGFAKGNGNLLAGHLKEYVVSGSGRHTLADFIVTCPRHATIPLSPVPPFKEKAFALPGGLFDEQTFGPLDKVLVHAREEKWGYINLPVPVEFPLRAFVKDRDAWHRTSKADQDKATIRFIKDYGLDSIVGVKLNVIPILPTRYRLPPMGLDSQVDDLLVADGYRPLLEACQSYQKCREAAPSDDKEKKLEEAEKAIRQAVEELFLLLVDALRGKFGILRRNGLGRRVDRSSRLVITPNPELEWNQVGIPPSVLWELMGDKVRAWMKGTGNDDGGSLEDLIAGRTELAEGWSWRYSDRESRVLGIVAENLRKYIAEHPDTLVLLNRQPSLHKYSFQALHPIVLNSEDGEVFQLSPLICNGFGADFDGDEMVGHYPVSGAAQRESAWMLPDNNLLSLATGKSLAHFDQDFVMGSYWISEFPDIFKRLEDCMPGDCCRQLKLFENERCGKALGEELLNHICMEHPDKAVQVVSEWLRLSLEACSRMGVSFGFYDLLEMTRKVKDQCKAVGRSNDSVQSAITRELERFLRDADNATAGLHVAGMAMSGARGKKQIRQLIGVRGQLDPGALGYEMSDADRTNKFWFGIPLTEGMDWNVAFFAAMNSRSSMCDKKLGTGHAGALTRKLVFALWPYRIVAEDCGSDAHDRSVATCREHGGFCAKCYGTLPNGNWPEVGYPAGLIAAQSIGERGTQLSMQSFHTGTRAFDMKTVRKILSNKGEVDYFKDSSQSSSFVDMFRGQSAYSGILPRHFQLLWRVLFDMVGHSLDNVIASHDPIANICYSKQAGNLLCAAAEGAMVKIDQSPIAEVLFNYFATKQA